MRRNRHGFTLVEIVISVFIIVLMLAIAVPSLKGVMSDRRLRRSLDELNRLVRLAQERSVADRRSYLIAWRKDGLVVVPEAVKKDEKVIPLATMPVRRGDSFALSLPAALQNNPPAEWIFWPSGTCEPVTIKFKGPDGAWTANYSSLTAQADLSDYAVR